MIVKQVVLKSGGAASRMELRDYFAAKAMQGVMSHSATEITPKELPDVVSICYDIADAMIAEREK